MKFRVISIKTAAGAHSPFRVVEQDSGREVGWINRYLDREYVRRLANKSLYSYAHSLLHFVRWWEGVHHTGDISEADLGESTLLDYIRFQSSHQPPPSASTINDRVACADRAIRNEFPDAPCQSAPGFHQVYLHRRPLGLGRPRFDLSRLRVKEPRLSDLVHRLRIFRSLDPLPDHGRLLAWHGSRVSLLARLRDYLHLACHSAGLPTTIVPHQLRHTYGTEMLPAGVGFAAVMKLLGHTDPGMTMRYVDVTLTDLQREFQLARSQPRHLAPLPKTSQTPLRKSQDGLIDSLLVAQHLLLVFSPISPKRQCPLPPRPARKPTHQNPLRNKQTPNQLNENEQRLAG